MRSAILSVLNKEVTLWRNSVRDEDLKRTLIEVGTMKARIEKGSANFFTQQGIDGDVSHAVYVINDLEAVKGDTVIFPDGTSHEILRVEEGTLFDTDNEYTVLYL